ncbi:MAG TPA: alpha/beta fold hydrolase [Terracidiphilus sp.]|nr:alpha/beta fold hydrolase [Terracidiphilus sp.]
MRKGAILFSAFALAVLPLCAQEKPLTVDEIFAHGPIIGEPPEQLTWSPDGKHLTYLDGGELMDVDPATGKTHVLVSAAKMDNLNGSNSSERDRDHRQRYGLASYIWAPDGTHILFDSNGRLWLYDLRNGVGVEIGDSDLLSGDDPKFSPDGMSVSLIKDHGLAVIPLRELGTPTLALAPAPKPSSEGDQEFLNGEVDWVYEEELDVRSNYFWSPDSKKIAYLQMNDSDVPRYPLADWIPNHATVAWQRYPQPGDPNPEVHLGVVPVHGGKTTWVRLPFRGGDDYVPRFGWVDNKTIWAETLTRDHKHLAVIFADPDSGETRQMLEISDDNFLDENYDVTVSGGAIVLTSWSDGHNHIYLYRYQKARPLAADARLDRQLTSGDFEVAGVYAVDVDRGFVDYASNEGNPLEQQIWQVSFTGAKKQLSAGAGFHVATFSPDGSTFTDEYSTRMTPPTVRVCHIGDASSQSGGSCRVFWQTHALDSYHLRAPTVLSVNAHDGTALYATLLLPESAIQPASAPLVVNPYGGPHDQTVMNQWSNRLLFDELLAQHGFAVLHADNRGMGSRGRAFAQAAYRNFGPVQLEDQLTVIDAMLNKYTQLDPRRLGWWGWSWGGTFTIYAMTHSPRFRAGVAVAPVTDWRDYDSIYTERYLGLPADDPDGYRDFSIVNAAADLKGRLLLAQGTGDDNVHFENTVQLVQRFIDSGIPYDLQIFPRKTHSLAGPEAQTQLYRRILGQFEVYLKPVPPAEAGK